MKREGTLDSMRVERIAAKLGHTLADVHDFHNVALNVARIAELEGFKGTGCRNLYDPKDVLSYWIVIFDVEATIAMSASGGTSKLDFTMERVELTAEQLVCRCEAHDAGDVK